MGRRASVAEILRTILPWVAVVACSAALHSERCSAKTLFDGETLTGWTELGGEGNGSWIVKDRALTPIGTPGDLSTNESFSDFELTLEWRIVEQGNSGVFIRVPGRSNPKTSSVEYQIADNQRTASQNYADRRTGAAYGLYAPTSDPARLPGAWNTSRIVANGASVVHWLNGIEVVSYSYNSDDFRARVERSKFAEYVGFGAHPSGRIVLQSHGHEGVQFRKIRLVLLGTK